MAARMLLVCANLTVANGQFVKTDAFNDLDPSEKRFASYVMGMAFAKVLCAQLLNIDRLVHISRSPGVHFNPAHVRADLVGQNRAGQWFAVEAKGRTNGALDVDLVRAAQQVATVAQINGLSPACNLAVVTELDPFAYSYMLDPDSDEDSPTFAEGEIQIDTEAQLRDYYNTVLAALTAGPVTEQQLGNVTVSRVELPGDLFIGLEASFYQWLNKPGDSPRPLVTEPRTIDDDDQGVMPDGVYVGLGPSWRVART